MATGTLVPEGNPDREGTKPAIAAGEVLLALAGGLAVVILTRGPGMRSGPLDSDEFGFLESIRTSWLPMGHTLFLASARVVGAAVGDPYRGFVILDMLVSAAALVSVWWWLRALVSPALALAASLALGCAPVFWAYGAMAGNYTAIVLVGSFLL